MLPEPRFISHSTTRPLADAQTGVPDGRRVVDAQVRLLDVQDGVEALAVELRADAHEAQRRLEHGLADGLAVLVVVAARQPCRCAPEVERAERARPCRRTRPPGAGRTCRTCRPGAASRRPPSSDRPGACRVEVHVPGEQLDQQAHERRRLAAPSAPTRRATTRRGRPPRRSWSRRPARPCARVQAPPSRPSRRCSAGRASAGTRTPRARPSSSRRTKYFCPPRIVFGIEELGERRDDAAARGRRSPRARGPATASRRCRTCARRRRRRPGALAVVLGRRRPGHLERAVRRGGCAAARGADAASPSAPEDRRRRRERPPATAAARGRRQPRRRRGAAGAARRGRRGVAERFGPRRAGLGGRGRRRRRERARAASVASLARSSRRVPSIVFDVDWRFSTSRGAVPRLKKNT